MKVVFTFFVIVTAKAHILMPVSWHCYSSEREVEVEVAK